MGNGVIGGSVGANDAEHINSVSNSLAVAIGGATLIEAVADIGAATILDAGAANALVGFRVAADSTDDTNASVKLSTGSPGVIQSGPGSTLTFNFENGITRIDTVGLGVLLAGSGAGGRTGGCVGILLGTQADILAVMVTFVFPEPVVRVTVSAMPAWSTNQITMLHVLGFRK